MARSEENLKKAFAKNLAFYRKKAGLTQLSLAEKLNYSDKLISKWERAEGLPSVVAISDVADIFGVTVSDMLSEEKPKRAESTHNKIVTAVLSCAVAWFVATALFILFVIVFPGIFKAWLFFIYAILASGVILVVFACLWGKKVLRFLAVSLLIWATVLSVVLSLPIPKISLLFILGGCVELLAVLWFLIKK